ncbi:ras-like protein family member 10B [Chironomus tepperi]
MHVYVLVFDMGNLDTFQYCRSIREQILSSFTHRNFSIMVVGNKIDLVVDSPNYTQELKDISALVRKHWRSDYIECSAKYNYKINDVFREVMGVSGMSGCSGAGIEFSQSSRHKSKCNIL